MAILDKISEGSLPGIPGDASARRYNDISNGLNGLAKKRL